MFSFAIFLDFLIKLLCLSDLFWHFILFGFPSWLNHNPLDFLVNFPALQFKRTNCPLKRANFSCRTVFFLFSYFICLFFFFGRTKESFARINGVSDTWFIYLSNGCRTHKVDWTELFVAVGDNLKYKMELQMHWIEERKILYITSIIWPETYNLMCYIIESIIYGWSNLKEKIGNRALGFWFPHQ